MRSPYISGSRINNPANFYNRTQLLDELSHQDSRAYYLKGNRRIGKSSLLMQLYLAINGMEKNQIAIFLNLDGCENEQECCSYFNDALNTAAYYKNITVFQNVFHQDDFVKFLQETLQTAKQAKLHVYLLVDEAESFLKLPKTTRSRLHRQLVNLHDNLKVVLTATSQLYRLNHVEKDSVPFLSNFTVCHIGCFDNESSIALIRQENLPQVERPIVAKEQILEILHLCGGHPYLTQLLCGNLFSEGFLRSSKATDILLDRLLSNFIEMDFNHLEPEEQKALKHFNFQSTKSAEDIPRECRNHIRELLHLGFLIEENDQYRLSNCFLSQWLEQHQDKEVEPLIVEPPTPKPKKIFLSYSKSDTEWKDKLKKQLRIYERNEQLTIWDDSLIQPGQSWSKEIEFALGEADIVLFLVSADLMATDFVMDTELPIALSRHQQGLATIIPVIMRPCQWTVSAFGELQAVPHKGNPVSTYSNEDEALNEVVTRIVGLLKT
ncbi:TIR domain-containing protein [Lewinella sp. LCG006]|uniref:TIR domain-containing protein n=1 Tax=Lewinella sp. LCG006 TaxID=3231911 RepID=UPI00345F80CF